MTPTEGELTSQEALQTIFQLHETMKSLGQLCLNHSSLQSQPQSSPKRNFYNAPQIGPHGLQENSISYERWSACQHTSNPKSSYLCIQAYYLPLCAACQFGEQ